MLICGRSLREMSPTLSVFGAQAQRAMGARAARVTTSHPAASCSGRTPQGRHPYITLQCSEKEREKRKKMVGGGEKGAAAAAAAAALIDQRQQFFLFHPVLCSAVQTPLCFAVPFLETRQRSKQASPPPAKKKQQPLPNSAQQTGCVWWSLVIVVVRGREGGGISSIPGCGASARW